MSFQPLSSDFYGYENALTDQEKSLIVDLRAFLETEVRPIVNGLWADAEFVPRRIVEGLAGLGLFGQP
ncbi:MAG: acyl-CoA dehydrogenase, partial [Microbacteriaceae bacterium]|nr:acyl-CoA dehydrogenase [Microbacteriaceae bacterium]